MYRRTRELAVEKFGPTNGADVEIELRDSGVWTRTGDWQIEVAWAGVDEVEEDPSLIEFRMKDGGSVIARKRAFADPQQMDSFLRLARERVAGSRSIG
ncbi:MAG: YcxB family protein [Holophagaceae bacterium]|nr:YcxB family protein [Holophagaceae bacterium]